MKNKERICKPLADADARGMEQQEKEASLLPAADKRIHSMESPRARLFKRLSLMVAYWVAGILELLFFSPGESGSLIFNFLASWGAVAAYRIKLGIVGVFLLFLAYSIGLFAMNSTLARYAWSHDGTRWRLPILQMIVHWTGVLLAFDKYGEFRFPSARELISVPGLVFMLTVILFPMAMSTLYIFLDWRIAIRSDPRS